MRSVGWNDRTIPQASLVLLLAAALLLANHSKACGQEPAARPRLSGLGPTGGQQFLTKHSAALGFRLSNPRAQELNARVLSFYEGETETQYGRDIWVPPNASMWSWFTIGPPAQSPKNGQIELKSLVRERTGSESRLVRAAQDPPLTPNLLPFELNQQITTLMLDQDISDGSEAPTPAETLARASNLRDLVHTMRHEAGLSPRLNAVRQRNLPPLAEAYAGIDQFILASDRITADVDGLRGLRAWLERGGRLWIPLDWVQQSTVSSLLGDLLNLQIIDRTSLTSVRFENGPGNAYLLKPDPREYEEPVDFVRVLAPNQQVYYTIDGWPAAFITEVGRGRVLFTTLGARAWMRPRTKVDPPSKYQDLPELPVGLVPADFLAQEVLMNPTPASFSPKDFESYVDGQISYQVVNQTSVLIVFGLLFAGLIAASLVLGKNQCLEHMGWVAPVLAVGAAGTFCWLGERARSAVPPTVAIAQTIFTEPGTGQAQASGLLAAYEPGIETAEAIGARDGGEFDFDLRDLKGRVRSRIQTDLNQWHWDNLELPIGDVRPAPFRYTAALNDPLAVTLRFGPNGLEGHVESGRFGRLEDALLTTPGRHALPIAIEADGLIRTLGGDSLETGHLLTSGLLTDQQRAHQSYYEKLLASPQPRYLATRNLLLGWTTPLDMHFSIVANARNTGMALVAIPLRFERTPPGTRVTIPSTFIDSRRVGPDTRLVPTQTEARTTMKTRLRFQLPASVLPMTIEEAQLSFRLIAPLREVVVNGWVDGTVIPLTRLSSPISTQHLSLTDPRLLRVDKRGCLYINIEVGDVRSEVDRDMWHLEWANLAVRGRTREQGEGRP